MLAEELSAFDRDVLLAMADLNDDYPAGVTLEELTERLVGGDQDHLPYVDDHLMASVQKLKRVGLLANVPGRLHPNSAGLAWASRL